MLLVMAVVTSQAVLALAQLNQATAYDHLAENGFPPGILPHSVESYDLEDNGKFTVYLERKCSFSISGGKIPVYYAKKISGVLRNGTMKNLTGVQAKAFKMWWSITGIEVSNEDLVLKSGFTSKTFPAANFEEIPVCDGSPVLSVSSSAAVSSV